MEQQVGVISNLFLLEQGLTLLIDFHAHILNNISGFILWQTFELCFDILMRF